MKHISISIIIALFIGNFAAAQTPWYLTGNSIALGDFLGTTNSQDLVFKANNGEKMRVTTGGNVGIGTTSPQNLFQVEGAGNASYSQFTNTASGSGSGDGMLVGIDASANGIINCRGGTPINFLTSGAKRMKIQGSGNILIGDYSGATAYNQVTQYVTGTGNLYHGFVNGNTGVSNTSGNDGFKIGLTYGGTYMNAELLSQQAGANMNFYTAPAAGTTTYRMQIAAGGSVGIGDNAQAADKLYVKNDYAVSSAHTGIETYTYATGSTPLTGIYAKAYSDGGTGSATMGGYLYALGTSSTSSGIGAKCVSENCDDSNFGVRAFGTGGAEAYGAWATAASGTTSNIGVVGEGVGSNSTTNIGVSAEGSGGGEAYGVKAACSGAAINYGMSSTVGGSIGATNYGVITSVSNTGATTNYGLKLTVSGATTNFGSHILCNGSAGTTGVGMEIRAFGGSDKNCGINSGAGGAPSFFSDANIGGHFSASDGNEFNYAVHASTASGVTCTGTTTMDCKTAAGFFEGNVVVTEVFQNSDSKLKTNIGDVINALGIIDQLQPKTFNYDTAQYNYMGLEGELQYGLIAQQVEQVLPQFVKEYGRPTERDSLGSIIHDKVDYLTVNYIKIIPILIAAIKEQQVQIQALQSGAKSTGSTNQLEIKLLDKTIVVLEQNNPNPFKDKTSISYNIPDDANSAQILFYNSKGNVISTVEITEKGAGSLLVYGADLTSGVYTYTLLVNDKVIETKKMMKVK